MSYTHEISGYIFVDNNKTFTPEELCHKLQVFVDNEPDGVKMYPHPQPRDNSFYFIMHINGKCQTYIEISKTMPLTITCFYYDVDYHDYRHDLYVMLRKKLELELVDTLMPY